MSPPSLDISASAMQKVIDYVLSLAPREACGLLAGEGGYVSYVYPIPNVHPDPLRGYIASRNDQAIALNQIKYARMIWIGIYHSHPPNVAPLPSSADHLLAAGHPDKLQLILSPSCTLQRVVAKAFHLAGRELVEIPLRVL